MIHSLKPTGCVGVLMSLTLCLYAPATAHAEDALAPVDQADLNAMIASGDMKTAFETAFEAGDELTEVSFDAKQGVGAYIRENTRFTRFPRADLTGPTEWANHFPKREGGANATSCIACHNAPFANGAGDVALNVVVDPAHSGDPNLYLERNTLPLFALGIPQRLAEEISVELKAQLQKGRLAACQSGEEFVALEAKGVSYGDVRVRRAKEDPCLVQLDTSGLDGIDKDLIVKPFGWKGNEPTIRSFTRNAAHNELGMQAVEIVGAEDGDFDGVINELSVGDMTALTVYMAALERPVRMSKLVELGLMEAEPGALEAIAAGEDLFAEVGCGSCHTPQMEFEDPTFREPSAVAGYYDAVFPDGSDPADHGVTEATRVVFDMTKDQPNNLVELADGTEVHLGALAVNAEGRAVAEWYTDFKRHDMGAALSDPADPLNIGASVFLTRSLAGVGSTGPWLHDGRATTLDEAIRAHGGAAEESAMLYAGLSAEGQEEIVAFLENLVIYQAEGEEEE